jgi:hypothetical protein
MPALSWNDPFIWLSCLKSAGVSPLKDTGRRTLRYDGLLFPPEQSFDKFNL